jgi:hypothetical protein
MKPDNLYFLSTVLLMFVLPIMSIVIDYSTIHQGYSLILLTGKWFVFWAIGLRLTIAGIKQVFNPIFTLEKIFHIHGKESQIVIKELGFANICFGLLGTISLFAEQFRLSAAIVSGLYFGLAGFNHIIKKTASKNEVIAMVSDIFIFLVMLVFVLLCILNPLKMKL